MTKHTDEEFEIMRKACYLWQDTALVWEQRALKAEAELARFERCRDKLECLTRYEAKS